MKQYRIDINIADDHVMVCEGLANAINRIGDIHVSRFFHTLEACRFFTRLKPAVRHSPVAARMSCSSTSLCRMVTASLSAKK